MAIALHPYIFFAGTCEEAMEFYQEIFGGELHAVPFGDESPDMAGLLMHARLDGEVSLLASDSTLADVHGHGKIHLSLSGPDEEKLRRWFDLLSEGGEVRSPLKKESWGDVYGNLVDKFGVNWMVNIGSSMEAST